MLNTRCFKMLAASEYQSASSTWIESAIGEKQGGSTETTIVGFWYVRMQLHSKDQIRGTTILMLC